MLCDALNEGLDDTGVDFEEVITGHTRLTWRTGQWAVVKIQVLQHVRGIPAGITTTSAPVRACFNPSSFGRYPEIFYDP